MSDKRKAPESSPTLYSYWRSSCSWRVRIALAIKKIEYNYKAVHLLTGGGQQFGEDFVKLNPKKEVPVLQIDGHTLFQSMAIISYLDETRPDTPLLPKDPYLRAKARALADIITMGTQPIQNLAVLIKIKKLAGGDDAKKMEWGKDAIVAGLDAFEAAVKETAGNCCVGDEVTIADICLVPQVYNARRFASDLTRWPTITKIEAHLVAMPAFKAADPAAQPDAE